MIKPVTYQGVFNFKANLYALEVKSRFIDQSKANGYYKGYGDELAAQIVGRQIQIGTGAFVVQGRMNEITATETVNPQIFDGFVGYVVARVETYHPSDEENCKLIAYVNRTFEAITLQQDDIYAMDADNVNRVYELPIYSFSISGNTITNVQKLIGAVEDYATIKALVDSANATAQTALTNANAAVGTANTANGTANAAKQQSAAAEEKADKAVKTADTAENKADNAVATANAANSKSDTAVSTANTAKTTAETANGKSDNAIATANGADTKADTAIETANAAAGTANAAEETADSAETKADNAVATAGAAESKADNAVYVANNAANTVTRQHEEMTEEINELKEAIAGEQGTTLFDGDEMLATWHIENVVETTDVITIEGGGV